MNLRVLYGVKGEGFTIMQFPVNRAAAILPMARTRGKFQGQIAPETPRGTYRMVSLRSASSWRTSSVGVGCLASHHQLAPNVTSAANLL